MDGNGLTSEKATHESASKLHYAGMGSILLSKDDGLPGQSRRSAFWRQIMTDISLEKAMVYWTSAGWKGCRDEYGGSPTDDNLVTLCAVCHDKPGLH